MTAPLNDMNRISDAVRQKDIKDIFTQYFMLISQQQWTELAQGLMKHPNIGEVSIRGTTLLMLTLQSIRDESHCLKAVQILLPYSNPNQRSGMDQDEWSALHFAAQKGFESIVKLLLPVTKLRLRPSDESVMELRLEHSSTAEELATDYGFHQVAKMILAYEYQALEKSVLEHSVSAETSPKGPVLRM